MTDQHYKESLNTKIAELEDKIIKDVKNENISFVNFTYELKPNFNKFYSPPEFSYDFNFTIKINNKTLNIIYRIRVDGVTLSDGAGGYDSYQTVNIAIENKEYVINEECENPYGTRPLSEWLYEDWGWYNYGGEISNNAKKFKENYDCILEYLGIDDNDGDNELSNHTITISKIFDKYILQIFLCKSLIDNL